jgi:purine catabolism regulator
LTVRELVRDLDIRLLTGEEALDAPVRWVHITELEDPTPFLSGGELLLSTGLQLSSAQRQRAFVQRLADHGLAGLGFGTGFAHDHVPAALVDAARERGLPLFEVPYDVPFIAVTETAFSRLVNEQYAVLRRAIAAHERLERIVLSERGIEAVAGALASLIGGAVLVFDARGGCSRARPSSPRSTTRRSRRSSASCASARAPAAPTATPAAAAASRPRRARSAAARSRCRSAPAVLARAAATARRCCRRGSWRPRTPAGCRSSTASRSIRR